MVTPAQKKRKKEKRQKMRRADALYRKAVARLDREVAQSFDARNSFNIRDPVPREAWFNIKGWRQ